MNTRAIGHLLLWMLGACSGKAPDTGPSPPEDEGPWSMLTDEIEDGVVLSAWSDGDVLRFVGGDLGGGPGILVRYADGALCVEREVTDHALWWIHGAAPGEWYAVGEAGTVLHATGESRVREDIPTDATLFGVWDTGDEVYAVGGVVGSGTNRGEIWVRRDGTWSALQTDLPGVLFKVWEDWFVGQDYSYVLDGDTLTETYTGERLLTVRGRDTGDVWAVGGLTGAVALHWDEGDWSALDTSGLGQVLNGVWTAADEPLWVAGNYGVTAFHDGTNWQSPDEPVTLEHLHAVWKHGDEVFWMGGNLFNAGSNRGVIVRYGDSTAKLPIEDCP